MNRLRTALSLSLALFVPALSSAQPVTKPATKPATNPNEVRPIPPPGNEVAPGERAELEVGVAKLGQEVEALRASLKDKPDLLALLPDVQVYHNAVRYPLVYRDLLDVKKARQALADGLERARQLREGKPEWASKDGPRGYVSRIDGSVQPYVLALPTDFKADDKTPRRLDLFCHGRDEKLTELNFIGGRVGNAPQPGPGKYVVLLYGRYCNANKFAGEIDCVEAIADVERRHPIDPKRRVITGFSMGGAAAWQFAVHYTDLWAAASPGAGFSESRRFLNLSPEQVAATPWYERRLWRWYDCDGYVANLAMLPTVAYAGETDKQKQASDVMLAAAEAEGVTIERLIGPKTGHSYEKATRAELEKRLDALAAKGRDPAPRRVRFSTYTLRYNRMDWVTIDALERHWEQARVEAELAEEVPHFRAKTANIGALSLALPGPPAEERGRRRTFAVEVDGQRVDNVEAEGGSLRLVKHAGKWHAAGAGKYEGLMKRPGLQGPIDDAFLDRFVIVKPTGKPMHARTGAWVTAECDRAIDQWRKTFRGEAQVRADDAVTDADIEGANLVLWGDPSSNKVLARIADRLPVKWTKDALTVGENAKPTYPADTHVPVLIYPNPLNPSRYVVLNSGFTFREADHLNNARQAPKLPDYAVIDVTAPPGPYAPGKVVRGGFFGERWELLAGDGQGD